MNKQNKINPECIHADLLSDIEAFCAARGLSDSKFGMEAMGDPTFLWDVRAGRELRRATIRRVRDWMQSQRIKP